MKKSWRRTEYLLGGMAAAAAFLVYLRTLQNGFVNWDDGKYIYKNPHIRRFDLAFLKWAFSNFNFSNWYPVTWISHGVDYLIWGTDPMGYHLTNIILHSANAFLVVVLSARLIEAWEKTKTLSSPQPDFFAPGPLARREGTERSQAENVTTGAFFTNKEKLIAAAATGLLFGLHPLHVESVAWASERKDVLYAFFFLLSILAYLQCADRLKGPSSVAPVFFERQYLLSLVFFVLALMSKPMAVSLPLILLILDWHPLGRIVSFRSFWKAFAEKIPFIVLSGCSSLLTLMAKNGKVITFKSLSRSERALVAARSLVLYIWKMVLPLNLVPYYPYPKTISFLSPEYFLPVILFAAITAFCLFKAKSQKIWLACWSYFVVSLLPVLGIVQVNDHWIADRYTYLPSLGPFLASGIAMGWAWKKAGASRHERFLKKAGASAALLAVLSMSYLTFMQIAIWKNDIVFWNYVIRKEPDKLPYAYLNRGRSFDNAGQLGKAIADFNKAIFLDPGYFKAYNNLGRVFSKTGQFDPAITEFDKAISLNPSFADAYNNLGITFSMMRRFNVALGDFNKALNLNPKNAKYYTNRGNVYFILGRKGHAAADFREACGRGDDNGCRALRQMGLNY